MFTEKFNLIERLTSDFPSPFEGSGTPRRGSTRGEKWYFSGLLGAGDRVILRIEAYLEAQSISLRPSGGYNHYLPSTKFAATPPDTLDADTAARFRAMFARINAIYN